MSQRAWAYFIGMGHYSAGLVRTGRVLARRRTALRDALNHSLPKFVTIETSPGASAYWVSVPPVTDVRALARRAARTDESTGAQRWFSTSSTQWSRNHKKK